MSTTLMWNPNGSISSISYKGQNVPVYLSDLARPSGLNDSFRVNVPITDNIGIDISTIIIGENGRWNGPITEITRDTGIQIMINYFNERIWNQLKSLDIPKGDGFGYFSVVVCGQKFKNWDNYFWADVAQKQINEKKW